MSEMKKSISAREFLFYYLLLMFSYFGVGGFRWGLSLFAERVRCYLLLEDP